MSEELFSLEPGKLYKLEEKFFYFTDLNSLSSFNHEYFPDGKKYLLFIEEMEYDQRIFCGYGILLCFYYNNQLIYIPFGSKDRSFFGNDFKEVI